ncbi:MAG TPA: hemerythrin domain-containing protein [Anaeromyxobacter sp.]|nr:hemerythrin domain-containing protein [Anaeromyxobacter sp.]
MPGSGACHMPLAWNETLSVNVDELDQQHREIITRLRLLGDALGADRRQSSTRGMAELVRCVAHHFRAEERFMRSRDYPRLGSHAQAHQVGLEALRSAERLLLASGPGERFRELVERSARWLDVHLRSEDLALGNFVRDGSAPPPAPAGKGLAVRAG